MFKFNTTNIFTGYLKQLLSSFNLPKYRVYTKENARYYLENHKESNEIIKTYTKTIPTDCPTESSGASDEKEYTYYANYIKDNYIQRHVNGKWENTNLHYHYNKHIPNHTKTLVVKNSVYDSYTHEYLGDYLRFMRDYNDVDLMPLYNCFSNKICSNLNTTLELVQPDPTQANPKNTKIVEAEFNSYDNNYKIYVIPVKLFKEYTIAIDCADNVEMFCGIYHKYLNTKFKDFQNFTYLKTANTLFSSPLLYSKLTEITDEALLAELAQQETNLKLFIKLPYSNNSSITILEGNYLNYNDTISIVSSNVEAPISGRHSTINNKLIVNLENINDEDYDYNDIPFKPVSELQLLKYNTQESYPFADRLVEYLTDNAITSIDEIGDNVLRVQKVLNKNNITTTVPGLWEDKYRIVLYSAMATESLNNGMALTRTDKMDCLGYVDKDVEQYYTYPQQYKMSDGQWKDFYISIGKVDPYENIYKAQAEQIKKQREGKK